MTAVPKRKLTLEQYLAIEAKAEFKSEFFNGEMFAMAGAGLPHNIVRENLSVEIGSRLKGGPCRTLSSDQRVSVERTGLYTYPDLLIVCGEIEIDPLDPMCVTNPRVIIEVLSESTERYDRGAKFRNYQQIPAFQEYILVSPDEPLIERFVRQPDGTWNIRSFTDLQGPFSLVAVPVELPMADVYRGITFDIQ